jgi:hypothetical protein
MPRNYDTTGHKPYPRVTKVEISYSPTGDSHTEYMEQMAVVDGDGNVQHIDASASRHILDFASITEPVQLVNPATGEHIAGQFVTKQQVMLSLLAFLRADQLRRDQALES